MPTLCFSRRPSRLRSSGCARSRWERRWMAFRMDEDILARMFLLVRSSAETRRSLLFVEVETCVIVKI